MIAGTTTECADVLKVVSAQDCASVKLMYTYNLTNLGAVPANITSFTGAKGTSILSSVTVNPLAPGSESITETVTVNACNGLAESITVSASAMPFGLPVGPTSVASAKFVVNTASYTSAPTPSPTKAPTPAPTSSPTKAPTSAPTAQRKTPISVSVFVYKQHLVAYLSADMFALIADIRSNNWFL